MNEIKILYNVFVTIISLLVASAVFSADAIHPLPNIVFIFADDLGWGDAGPRKNPESPVITSNIDRLANEGMRFTDAHTASSVCAPSRYAAMTGNNPFRGRRRWGTWDYLAPSQILNGQKTVADVLKSAGYRTAFFGKWHMGGDFFEKGSDSIYRGQDPNQVDFTRRFRSGPFDHGFDYSFTLPSGIQSAPFAYFENDKYIPIDPANSQMVFLADSPFTRAGFGDPNWDSRDVGSRLAKKAVGFIDRHNRQYGKQKPFLLYYASQAPHGPYTPPVEFDGEPVKGVTGLTPRLDMVAELDLQVGKIIKALETRGLDDNTLIIITSDNGGYQPIAKTLAAGHHGVGGLRGQKAEVYDGGHRVPFIAKWGDGTKAGSMITPGSVNNQLIAVNDWVASMYALTNQAMPADQALDSANILPLLLGKVNEPVRSYLTVDATPGVAGNQKKWRTIRKGKWALLLDATDTPRELYNMATDLKQTTNLIDKPSQSYRISKLRDLYLYAMNQSKRTVPDPCGAPKLRSDSTASIDLWKDCGDDNEWHLRATGIPNGSKAVFLGEINSEDTFMGVVQHRLTPHDSIYDYINTDDPLRIKYGFKIWGNSVNGFDFKVSADSPTCLNTITQPANTIIRLGAFRQQITAPFNLSTLSNCSPPMESECGEPSYNPDTFRGSVLWRDCPSDQWHYRVADATKQSGSVYNGFFVANQRVNNVIAYNLNSNDFLDFISNPKRIEFEIKVSTPNINGIDFTYPSTADVCFGLTQSPNQKLMLGKNKIPVALPINLATLQACIP